MSTTNWGRPHPFPAGQRTVLLHRMLVVRHLAEHHAATPSPNPGDVTVDFRVGEEAAAAGVLTALGPCDAMVAPEGFTRAVALAREDLRVHRATVTVCLFEDDADDWLDVARRDRLPMLFCRRSDHGSAADPHEPLPEETIDSGDVEAVLPRIRESLRTIRAGGGPGWLSLRTGAPADPVETLVVRMFAAHQLDDNALRAIDADADAQVAAMLAAPSGGSC
jgi:hypothetical protein